MGDKKLMAELRQYRKQILNYDFQESVLAWWKSAMLDNIVGEDTTTSYDKLATISVKSADDDFIRLKNDECPTDILLSQESENEEFTFAAQPDLSNQQRVYTMEDCIFELYMATHRNRGMAKDLSADNSKVKQPKLEKWEWEHLLCLMIVHTTSQVASYPDFSSVFEYCEPDYINRLMLTALRCTRVIQFRNLQLNVFKIALLHEVNCLKFVA